MFVLSSAHAFNLDQSKIMSFGKELNSITSQSETVAGTTVAPIHKPFSRTFFVFFSKILQIGI